MHEGGKEIISAGFPHVVEITNYILETNGRPLINIAKSFILSLDFELQADDRPYWKQDNVFQGHRCRYCIQDGDLPGLGIYVFFDTQEGKSAALHWAADFKGNS